MYFEARIFCLRPPFLFGVFTAVLGVVVILAVRRICAGRSVQRVLVTSGIALVGGWCLALLTVAALWAAFFYHGNCQIDSALAALADADSVSLSGVFYPPPSDERKECIYVTSRPEDLQYVRQFLCPLNMTTDVSLSISMSLGGRVGGLISGTLTIEKDGQQFPIEFIDQHLIGGSFTMVEAPNDFSFLAAEFQRRADEGGDISVRPLRPRGPIRGTPQEG